MRWIAGAKMQQVGRKTFPTTSIGQAASVLGGILKASMHLLKMKDDANFKATGVRRYFIVTSVDQVADRLKKLRRDQV